VNTAIKVNDFLNLHSAATIHLDLFFSAIHSPLKLLASNVLISDAVSFTSKFSQLDYVEHIVGIEAGQFLDS